METQTQGSRIRTQLSRLAPDKSTLENSEDTYNAITLDADEEKVALYEAKKKKFFQIRQADYWNSVNKTDEILTYDAGTWFELFKTKYNVENEIFHDIVWKLCLYFAGDPEFEKTHEAGSLTKGLLLMGAVGTGKSNLMKFFKHNSFHSFRIESALKITDDYKEYGEKPVREFYNVRTGEKNKFGQQIYGHCFDDLGTEQIPAMHYNQEKNVMSEILQFRYGNLDHFNTHLTTNLDAKDLEKCYGSRAYDRMKEMFNVIVFNNIPSFRK